MYEEHPSFKMPAKGDSTKIWRYMDFTQFVSLLVKEALFFISGDKLLEDPFEGGITEYDRKAFIRNTKEFIPKDTANEILSISAVIKHHIAINSWHMNEHECAAMWKTYLKSDEGIAVQSTYGRLKESFDNWSRESVFIGTVVYLDHINDSAYRSNSRNQFDDFLWKRNSYSYEKELRAVIFRIPTKGTVTGFEDTENGAYIGVELDILIDKIVVSPIAEPWFRNLVRAIMEKYDLRKEIETSSLAERPMN